MHRKLRSILFVLLCVFASAVYPQGSDNVTLIANVNDYPQNGYTDCWGYTDPDGREYAILCVDHGTSIIDITENNNIREVAFIPSDGTKDFKTYRHYAYGVNENIDSFGMVIIELSDLPNSARLVKQFFGFRGSHNIFIDEANGVLYAQNRNNTTNNDAVRVLSLADPENPVEIATFGLGCHDIFARGNIAYISESNNSSVGIYDLTSTTQPTFRHRIPFPGNGFSHNAWLTDNGNFLITTEETNGHTVKLWDIRDPENPEIASEFLAADGTAHNAFIKGNFAYISHYTDGLRILDISDRFDMKEVGFYDTFPETNPGRFAGAWGVYPFFNSGKVLISDMKTGLYVVFFDDASGASALDPRPPAHAGAYSDFRTPTSVRLNWQDPESYVGGAPLTDFTIEIHRDGVPVASVAAGVETFEDHGLVDGQKYFYSLFAKDQNDSLSVANNVSAYAGGAPKPKPPLDAFFSGRGPDSLVLHWQNPNQNIDGTPLDDFAGVNVFRDGLQIAQLVRTNADTSRRDSLVVERLSQSMAFRLSSIDNESPFNESERSSAVFSPHGLPFVDTFENQDRNNPTFWSTFDAELSTRSVNPPSPNTAIHLDGWDNGGDEIESVPLDLSGGVNSEAYLVSFWFETQGQHGPNTGPRDTMIVEFKNSLGEWREVRRYQGNVSVRFFTPVTIHVADENPGPGATFFHFDFKIRFRTAMPYIATGGDFFVDNVRVGIDSTVVSVAEAETGLPESFALFQNYPNPFNPTTVITYHLPRREYVELNLFNTRGQLIRRLVDAAQDAGTHRVVWDGRDDAGQKVPSAVYFYRLQAGDFSQARRLLVLH
ncbi:choice-of-anchor B family protein [candidate division KSB1 bacterium]|nr:choice-of-anchor B family protein [candidate division KSB1 bacterium]NIR71332.1 choice-of-anchor B family protein [candidate division KSB1 bacterium]NIS26222.1 choice-of-anchor B family protein [candidate division KSB1 bacterium]NIT74652.1 choice-of-anchor B family protein [candidate division KSB1 bacterium]NIU26870.1 choice-of-anchor B family protein [candidate division KSB1 bacterium]